MATTKGEKNMKCPKCGAEMKSTKCEYCQSEISQEELDNKRKENEILTIYHIRVNGIHLYA